MRILVVEDEKSLADIIASILRDENYSVDVCLNGSDAIDYLDGTSYDCAILDLLLPDANGISVLRHIRNLKNTSPVIILTALGDTANRVRGLDSGADDYLVKPFDRDELLARIRAVIRRRNNQQCNELYAGDLILDISNRVVFRGSKMIDLSSKEYAVLEYLLYNKNKYLSREQIIAHIWNYDFECASNIVDVYIRYLRKKIDDGFEKKLIFTQRGTGYCLKDPEESK